MVVTLHVCLICYSMALEEISCTASAAAHIVDSYFSQKHLVTHGESIQAEAFQVTCIAATPACAGSSPASRARVLLPVLRAHRFSKLVLMAPALPFHPSESLFPSVCKLSPWRPQWLSPDQHFSPSAGNCDGDKLHKKASGSSRPCHHIRHAMHVPQQPDEILSVAGSASC